MLTQNYFLIVGGKKSGISGFSQYPEIKWFLGVLKAYSRESQRKTENSQGINWKRASLRHIKPFLGSIFYLKGEIIKREHFECKNQAL